MAWQHISTASPFTKLFKLFKILLAALECSKIHPPQDTTNACQPVLSYHLWHTWQGWQHISIASPFPKLFKLWRHFWQLWHAKNTPSPQDITNACQPVLPYHLWHTWQGWQHISYTSLFPRNSWTLFWQLWHAWKYTYRWDITNVSHPAPAYGIYGRAGNTFLLLLS